MCASMSLHMYYSYKSPYAFVLKSWIFCSHTFSVWLNFSKCSVIHHNHCFPKQQKLLLMTYSITCTLNQCILLQCRYTLMSHCLVAFFVNNGKLFFGVQLFSPVGLFTILVKRLYYLTQNTDTNWKMKKK